MQLFFWIPALQCPLLASSVHRVIDNLLDLILWRIESWMENTQLLTWFKTIHNSTFGVVLKWFNSREAFNVFFNPRLCKSWDFPNTLQNYIHRSYTIFCPVTLALVDWNCKLVGGFYPKLLIQLVFITNSTVFKSLWGQLLQVFFQIVVI